jgi:hypothetical protein
MEFMNSRTLGLSLISVAVVIGLTMMIWAVVLLVTAPSNVLWDLAPNF